MNDAQWRSWTPQYDGHAPDDWDGSHRQAKRDGDWFDVQVVDSHWHHDYEYRYHTKQPDLLAQCLRLPQADREALIEALQKPQRDWADDVADTLWYEWEEDKEKAVSDMAAVIRSMCRPKEEDSATELLRAAYGENWRQTLHNAVNGGGRK